MSLAALIALAGAIVTEVFGTLSLRMASEGKKLFWVGVMSGYLAAFYFLTITLKEGAPLGVAYGIWAAAGVALTALISRIFFREHLNWIMVLGMALICSGVFVVQLGTQT